MSESKCTIGCDRIKSFVNRATAGEELVVAFFGGSITQGSLASTEEKCYAYLFYRMLADRYPQAKLTYVNAGIGGTGSHYGAMRVREDLLSRRPDLVVLDFSVNDTEAVLPLYGEGETDAKGGTEWSRTADTAGQQDAPLKLYPETWEGVLRRILSFETHPAVLILNNSFYDTGDSVEDEHNAIADHYGVPHMSIRERILPHIRDGRYAREELSPDGLHPNDLGHRLIAEELMKVMETFSEQEAETTARNSSGAFPAPVTPNGYERTERLNSENSTPALSGFAPDTDPHDREEDRYNFFRKGWTASNAGDRFSLEMQGRSLAVVYRKTVHRPAPVARLILDGDTEHAVILDSNFDQDWGDCLFLQPILHHGGPGDHHIEIEIIAATPEDQAPFYLLSIGVSE